MDTKELMDKLGDRKILSLTVSENADGDPVSVVLDLDSGDKFEFTCTSYNYGPQHLVLEFN